MVARESANRRDDTHLRARRLDDRLLVRQFDHGGSTRWQNQDFDRRQVSFEQTVRLRFAIGVYVSCSIYSLFVASSKRESKRENRCRAARNDLFGCSI